MGPFVGTVRARTAVIAALLHDVIDDAHVAVEEVQSRFGREVAGIVAKVSQLSAMNQLLRRRRRMVVPAEERTGERSAGDAIDDQELRTLILSMVDEPLVILIKLADRLHNMRTIYALKPAKRRAVAQETLSVWCSLAERLGMFALKVGAAVCAQCNALC
jgi:(p)ppGpp synthase/HD superfamily hydrolase